MGGFLISQGGVGDGRVPDFPNNPAGADQPDTGPNCPTDGNLTPALQGLVRTSLPLCIVPSGRSGWVGGWVQEKKQKLDPV